MLAFPQSESKRYRTQLSLGVYLIIVLECGQADIVLDGSLGQSGGLVGPNFQIKQEVGIRNGNNLFHSFARFNIFSGESATFSGDAAINNIFARVTGGTGSTIDGALNSSIPGADLYFLNPAGIIFGPQAQLNIGGSFHVSTADYIAFAEGNHFSAHDLEAHSTFSTAAVEAFGFLSNDPGKITMQSVAKPLAVKSGENISMIGGDIAIVNSTISAPDGGVNLVSRKSAGQVSMDLKATDLLVSDFRTEDYGPMTLTRGSHVITDGSGGDGISVLASNFLLSDGSTIQSSIRQGNNPGNPIRFVVENMTIAGLSQIGTGTFTEGEGGAITIHAQGKIFISGGVNEIPSFSGVFSNSFFNTGKAGDIVIQANKLEMRDGGMIGGDVVNGSGATADIMITVDQLTMDSGSNGILTLISSSYSSNNPQLAPVLNGKPGIIDIRVTDRALISGNRCGIRSANTVFNAKGQPGKISIYTPNELILTNGARIEGSTINDINAADIVLNVKHLRVSDGAVINSSSGVSFVTQIGNQQVLTVVSGSGDGGNIQIQNAETISITNTYPYCAICSVSFGEGKAGEIDISTGLLTLDHALISTSVNGLGDAGNISIAADYLRMNNASAIASISNNLGNAGDIEIVGLIDLFSEGSQILTEAAQADGGNITVQADDSILLKDSVISTSVLQGGDGGNIAIDPVFTILENSQIIAQAIDGDGGNISINTDYLFQSNDSLVSATSQKGIDGEVQLAFINSEALHGVDALPATSADVTTLLTKPCSARVYDHSLQFVMHDYTAVLPVAPSMLQVYLPDMTSAISDIPESSMQSMSVNRFVTDLDSAWGC